DKPVNGHFGHAHDRGYFCHGQEPDVTQGCCLSCSHESPSSAWCCLRLAGFSASVTSVPSVSLVWKRATLHRVSFRHAWHGPCRHQGKQGARSRRRVPMSPRCVADDSPLCRQESGKDCEESGSGGLPE